MTGRYGRRRGVQEQGPHQERAAAWNFADHFAISFPPLLDFRRVQFAMPVRTGQNPKRAVYGVAVVQMQPNREQAFQHVRRGVRVGNACFCRPGAEAGNFAPLFYGDAQVLMIGDFPVRLRGLVEEDSAHSEGVCSENGTN